MFNYYKVAEKDKKKNKMRNDLYVLLFGFIW